MLNPTLNTIEKHRTAKIAADYDIRCHFGYALLFQSP
jgi:hypothetical protein